MIQANELRIGSILNYDTAEGDILPTTIGWQDLKWISEDHKGFNLCHSPIPLGEEILLKCGFVARGAFWYDLHLDQKTKLTLGWHPDGRIDFEISINKIYFDISHIEYLHQLQNLYFALTGTELEINL